MIVLIYWCKSVGAVFEIRGVVFVHAELTVLVYVVFFPSHSASQVVNIMVSLLQIFK
jgi:hypothetical protein